MTINNYILRSVTNSLITKVSRQLDMFPLESLQSLPSVGQQRGELQGLLLLLLNHGPGLLQVSSVEVEHRHPRRGRGVFSCTLTIFQRTELILATNQMLRILYSDLP